MDGDLAPAMHDSGGTAALPYCWSCKRSSADLRFYKSRQRTCVDCVAAESKARSARRKNADEAGINIRKTYGHLCRLPLTAEVARSMMRYDPETGFVHATIHMGTRCPGDRIGTPRPDGRWQITVGRKHYLEHRVIWLLVHGEWPEAQIDHEDLGRGNNKIKNLRPCDNSQNNANRRVRPDSNSGLKGVAFDARRGKWRARITHDWKTHWLGYYETKEAAHAAYVEAAQRFFGEFARAA